MNRILATFVVGMCLCLSACGGSSTSAAPTPTPTPTIASLNGTVTVTGGARIENVTVTILDGPNQGRTTTTNSNGDYTFDQLTRGNANLSAKKMPMYDGVSKGLYIDGTSRLDFSFPTPGCETNNTAWVTFENHSTATVYSIVWDGVGAATLNPGAVSEMSSVAAGVAHRLDFLNATTRKLACSTSYPILSRCSNMHYWCDYNAVTALATR